METYSKVEVDKLIGEAEARAVEKALRALPFIIKNLIVNASALKEASEQFYKDNPDFVNHKDLVAKTMERVEADNPGKTIDVLLTQTAKKVKEQLTTGQQLPLTYIDRPAKKELNEGIQNILGAFDEGV